MAQEAVRPDEPPAGGWWDQAGWRRFLEGWSAEALAVLHGVPPAKLSPLQREVLARGTLLEPGAAPEAIAELEARIGRPLPPSYKAFLAASGSWPQLAMDADDGRFWPPARVRWFREQEPGWLAAWMVSIVPDPDDATYFDYGPHQDPVHLRRSYLPATLAVSEGIASAIYLLNPKVHTPRGEWEAWFFGNALPGALRYRSFQELMTAERPRSLAALRYLTR
jgi:hypothetical protein